MSAAALNRRTLLKGLAASTVLAASTRQACAQLPEPSLSRWGGIELLDSDERRFRVGDGTRPFTLIKLWANWCSVCLRELDLLPAITSAFGSQAIEVILVSHPQDWARNQEIARHRGLRVRCARPSLDNERSAVQSALIAADGVFYVPRSVLFSRSRQSVVWSHVGGIDWTSADALAPIRQRLG